MNASRRPPPPASAVSPRRVADGAGKALRESMGEPDDSFAEGVEAHRNADALVREGDLGVSLHGTERLIRFPKHLQDLFTDLDKSKAEALLRLAAREADRTVFSRVWSGAWKIGIAIALPVYGITKWGVEQIPFLKELYNIMKGHG